MHHLKLIGIALLAALLMASPIIAEPSKETYKTFSGEGNGETPEFDAEAYSGYRIVFEGSKVLTSPKMGGSRGRSLPGMGMKGPGEFERPLNNSRPMKFVIKVETDGKWTLHVWKYVKSQ